MFSEMSVFAISRDGHNFCENLRSGNLSRANDGADPGVSHGAAGKYIFKQKYLHFCRNEEKSFKSGGL